MTGLLIIYLTALCVCVRAKFHLPSRVQYDGKDGSLFGFSLSYQKSKGKLIVGTPRIDLEGGVESCPIWTNGTETCDFILQSKNINSTWGEFSRQFSPDQHFMLGATVAASSEYVLACAPLLTINYKIVNKKTNEQNSKHIPIGRCFIQKGTSSPSPLPNPEDILGLSSSLGWSALVDEADDTLLISKLTGAVSAIMYTSASDPTELERSNLAPIVSTGRYLGPAMTFGVFFSDEKKVYATAFEDTKRMGYVGFSHFAIGSLQAFQNLYITAKRGRNMFGAALHMADFNEDEFSELVVGAPADPYKDEYEAGAIYVYSGGFTRKKIKTIEQNAKCVRHNKPGSRFGTALASMDLDDDGLPELFISAPYEKKGGTVYYISGLKVKALLKEENNDCTLITAIQTQTITSEFKSFGYVMQPALNFNNNGAKVLAIGAPLVDKVFVYRSISAVKVNISAKVKDKEIVLETDKRFIVTITLNIKYPTNQNKSSGFLFVIANITDRNENLKLGSKPVIDGNSHFKIDLAMHETLVIIDVVVKMGDELPHTYDFVASVHCDESHVAKKQFDESLIRLSDDSTREYSLQILRRCKGGECVPKLTMELKWSQSCPTPSCQYVVGSSLNETLTVAIRNDGDSSYASCAKVFITGAKMADWSCESREIRDTCRFTELKRSSEHPLTIQLDMSRFSYGADKLDIVVKLYNVCSDMKPVQIQTKTIKYVLNTDDIAIKGSYYPLNITDLDIVDASSATVGLLQTFMIRNNGSIAWEQLLTEIKILKQPYIADFIVLNQDFYCQKQNDANYIKYSNCTLNLDANTYIDLKTQINITKNAVVKHTNNSLLIFKTEMHLAFSPTEANNFTLDASAMYVEDLSFKNQKNTIIIIAIIFALLVLLIIGIVLYKCGFFERNTKKELNELKKEYRRRSTIRRPESSCYQRLSAEGELHIEEIQEDDQQNLCPEHPKSS